MSQMKVYLFHMLVALVVGEELLQHLQFILFLPVQLLVLEDTYLTYLAPLALPGDDRTKLLYGDFGGTDAHSLFSVADPGLW